MKHFILTFLFLISTTTWAKRAASSAKPVHLKGVEFFYAVEDLTTGCPAGKKVCGAIVFMTARNQKTKTPVWKIPLYQNRYRPGLETDAQTILPRSMKILKRDRVQLIDDTGRHFIIHKDGRMEWPAGVRLYHGRK